ncbi:hypothetical protein JAAARDRAFT_142542, partial [Jaapia argillacea MUCL 33604]
MPIFSQSSSDTVNDQGADLSVSLHLIPHLALGKVGRACVRLFFPRLYGSEPKPITQDHRRQLYNLCIREAVRVVVPDSLARWPVSYDAAFKLYQDRQGLLHMGALDISVMDMARFNTEFRDRLEEIPDFRDSFYLHEVRGTKGSHGHDGTELLDRNISLDDLCQFLYTDLIDPSEWWIDVGYEISYPDHVLQWLEVAHTQMVKVCLPKSVPGAAERLVNGKRFKVDRTSLLGDFAGFRVQPKTAGRNDSIVYLHAYTTDKCATYQLHSGAFRRHFPSDLLPMNMKGLLRDVQQISSVFGDCSQNETQVPGCTRLEVRATLSTSREHLTELPDGFLEEAVVALPAEQWWAYRFYRVAALHYVFRELQVASSQSRMWKQSLGLGAIAVWMLNGMIFRQGEDNIEIV